MANDSSIPAVPTSPTNIRIYSPYNRAKIATPDLLVDTGTFESPEIIQQLILEDIGGQELINISRHDLVNGQNLKYSPVKNLASIAIRYSSNNIIPIQNTSNSVFNNFSIKLDLYLPNGGTNASGEYLSSLGTGPNGEPIYIDEKTGDIVVNFLDVPKDQQVEIQVLKTGEAVDATIYEG